MESESKNREPEVKTSVDTTAAEARQGKDIQAIPWSRLKMTREHYREQRLKKYKTYENIIGSCNALKEECKSFTKGGKFYEFFYNARSVQPSFVHFQLRNQVWATSKHDVYVTEKNKVLHWSPTTRQSTEVLRTSDEDLTVDESQTCLVGYRQKKVRFSTMCVKRNLLALGGFEGELVCTHLDRPGVEFESTFTEEENATSCIVNCIEIYDVPSRGTNLMVSRNDSNVRVFDSERLSVLNKFKYEWPINHTSMSPDGRVFIVMGDSKDGLLADSKNGEVIETLRGHLDFSFASAWHPDGNVFATGNQDKTCRLWDTRNLTSSFATLKSNMSSIRSIRYTSDGRFMAMAEAADFVQIFDTQQDYDLCQEIDIFGEIAGISFSPDTEALFVGLSDRTYGGVMEFHRSHSEKED